MKRSYPQIVLSLLAVFLSGAVVGGFAVRLYTVHTVVAAPPKLTPEEFRNKYVGELKARLGLNGGQVTQLNTILDQTRDKYELAKKQRQAEFDGIHDEQVSKVRGMLSASQVAEYEKFRAERRAKRNAAAGPKS